MNIPTTCSCACGCTIRADLYDDLCAACKVDRHANTPGSEGQS